MEEGDIKAPLYYVVGKRADVEIVQRLLTITPCFFGVACTQDEYSLLLPLVEDVLQAVDEGHRNSVVDHIAHTTGKPVLIVGEGNDLKAVYSTGEEETIKCSSKQT